MTELISNQEIRTSRGLVKTSDIEIGDMLLSPGGGQSVVIGVSHGNEVVPLTTEAGTLITPFSQVSTHWNADNGMIFDMESDNEGVTKSNRKATERAVRAMREAIDLSFSGSTTRGAIAALKELGVSNIGRIQQAFTIAGISDEGIVHINDDGRVDYHESGMSGNYPLPVGEFNPDKPRDMLGYMAVMTSFGRKTIRNNGVPMLVSAGGVIFTLSDSGGSIVLSHAGSARGVTSRIAGFLLASGVDITAERFSFITGVPNIAIRLLESVTCDVDYSITWTDRPPYAVIETDNPVIGCFSSWNPDITEFIKGIVLAGAVAGFVPSPTMNIDIDAIPGLSLSETGIAVTNMKYVRLLDQPTVEMPGLFSTDSRGVDGIDFIGTMVKNMRPSLRTFAVPGDASQAADIAYGLFENVGSGAWGMTPDIPWAGKVDDMTAIATPGAGVYVSPEPAFFDDDPDYDFFEVSESSGEYVNGGYVPVESLKEVTSNLMLSGYGVNIDPIPIGDEKNITVFNGIYRTELSETDDKSDTIIIKHEGDSGVLVGAEGIPVL